MPTTTIDLSSDFNGLYNRILRYLRLSSALRQQSAFVVIPEHMKATAAQQLLASTFAGGIILAFANIDRNSHETLHWDGFGSIRTRR